MIRNYLMVALRDLLRHKLHSCIAVGGLAFGMACFLMVFGYVQFEASYDTFHVNASTIYRLDNIWMFKGYQINRSLTGAAPGPLLRAAFPAIAGVVRFGNLLSCMVSVDENVHIEKRFLFADSAVFSMFTFPLKTGDPKTALSGPFTVVLTPRTARKYFGDASPLGRTIYFQTRAHPGKFGFTVTGVTEDIPSNSTIQFDFLASFSSYGRLLGLPSLNDSWDGPVWTYLQLQENADPGTLEAQFPGFAGTYVPKGDYRPVSFRLVPLTATYYDKGDGIAIGDWGIRFLSYILLAVSVLVLCIACFNYASLVSARSITRAREIGVRKVQGASRAQLIAQFLGESVLVSLIALVCAIGVLEALLPSFRAFLSDLYPSFGILARRESDVPLLYPRMLCAMALLAVLVGIVSGLYPALVLSSQDAAHVLNGERKGGTSPALFRKILVVTQFAFSTVFVVCSLHILVQIHSWKHSDLSFDSAHVIAIPVYDGTVREKYEVLKARLLQNAGILGVTSSSLMPGGEDSNVLLLRSGAVRDLTVVTYFVDEDFVKTLGLTVAGGKDLSHPRPGGTRVSVLLNEGAMNACGWNDAHGQEVELYTKENDRATVRYTASLAGMVKNFRYRFFKPVDDPLILVVDPSAMNYIFVRVNGAANTGDVLEYMKASWKGLHVDQAFEYSTLAEELGYSYSTFEAMDAFIRFAAIVTIVIASLGLYALASFVIDRKTKEIGIRKVMGAPVRDIVYRLSRSFILLVVIANIVALPVAYKAASLMLQELPHHMDVKVWLLLAAAGFLVTLSAMVIGVKSSVAAGANPVQSLRHE